MPTRPPAAAGQTPGRLRLPVLALFAALLAGCASQPGQEARQPAEVRAELVRKMLAATPDREGWAADIQAALAAQRIDPGSENLCAVLAVIEQESGYQADPRVDGLARIARAEIDRRAAARHIPRFVVTAALKVASPDGRSYAQRLQSVRSERELSELYEDIIGRVPLGKRLFAGMNPVQTGGPMQVSIGFAQANARSYPYPVAGDIRDEVFTRRGGLYFGIAHLLGYATPYTRKLHRFADYNAGWYASRNAAFQNAVSQASGIPLALDGDLLAPGAAMDAPGKTEIAVRALGARLGMDDPTIRRALQRSGRLDFGETDLYARVFALADTAQPQPLPRALVPGIALQSPKITRKLTTAWFADRVNQRYQRCMQKP